MSWKPRLNAKTFDKLEGVGRIRVYDNDSKTMDRYSVLFEDLTSPDTMSTRVRPYGPRQSLGLSESPGSPQGVSMWASATPGPWLGRRIRFDELPIGVQQHVIARATE